MKLKNLHSGLSHANIGSIFIEKMYKTPIYKRTDVIREKQLNTNKINIITANIESQLITKLLV